MVERIDLADAGSPEAIVSAILREEPDLAIPVPIKELCLQLDVEEIVPLTISGFEGALFTDRDKSRAIIGYNDVRPRQRRRFTVAHELGHFLIPTHFPDVDGQFLCSASDMNIVTRVTDRRRAQIESEANRFAALMLMPPPFFRKDIGTQREPSISGILELAKRYDTSKEATARWYIQFLHEPYAVIVGCKGKVVRHYKNDGFPYIVRNWGDEAPAGLIARRNRLTVGDVTEWRTASVDDWLDVERGRRAPEIFEQVHAQRDGFWLALLQLEQQDEEVEEEEDRLRESLEVGFRK